MKTARNQILFLLFFAIYISTVLLTDISLTGFWTDIIFTVLLAVFSLKVAFRASRGLKVAMLMLSIVVFGWMIMNLLNPFMYDTFKMRSFLYQKVEGRIFHAYFKPVGAYSGGEGNFWITESPVYFPVIEYRVYYNRTVTHDFNNDIFDGVPIDNYEVVKTYIKDEVIEKK